MKRKSLLFNWSEGVVRRQIELINIFKGLGFRCEASPNFGDKIFLFFPDWGQIIAYDVSEPDTGKDGFNYYNSEEYSYFFYKDKELAKAASKKYFGFTQDNRGSFADTGMHIEKAQAFLKYLYEGDTLEGLEEVGALL